MLANIYVSRDILANNEMGLLSSFLNSFKKLVGMLAGPNAFLAFSELIIDITCSSFVALNVKVSSIGSKRLFEKWKLGVINFASICLAIFVKWLFRSVARNF